MPPNMQRQQLFWACRTTAKLGRASPSP